MGDKCKYCKTPFKEVTQKICEICGTCPRCGGTRYNIGTVTIGYKPHYTKIYVCKRCAYEWSDETTELEKQKPSNSKAKNLIDEFQKKVKKKYINRLKCPKCGDIRQSNKPKCVFCGY